jgi:hypothetical protein
MEDNRALGRNPLVLQASVWLTAEALRTQSWKIDRAKTPRTQRKNIFYLSELGGLCAFARDILTFFVVLPSCVSVRSTVLQ